MKIEKLKSILYDDCNADTLTKIFSICGNKINELIEQTNENTEILVKTIRALEKVTNYSTENFKKVEEALQ